LLGVCFINKRFNLRPQAVPDVPRCTIVVVYCTMLVSRLDGDHYVLTATYVSRSSKFILYCKGFQILLTC
jgi:hypothetical protein